MTHSAVQFRQGCTEDEQWLFELFRLTMQEYIDAAWGWEERLQREGFVTSLPARGFQILHNCGKRLGCYYLRPNTGSLLLEMILVEPDCQGQGYGRLMMDHIKATARRQQQAVFLRVLKTNPAVAFHRRCGFQQSNADEHSLEMIWQGS
jgi:N-acetylglutamate synthase-like GNAT family acetyltransferase